MNTTISTIAISPVLTMDDMDGCIRELNRLRGPVKDAENIYMNPVDGQRLCDAIKNTPTGSFYFPAVTVFAEECIPAGFFCLMSAKDFELYKYLKGHSMLTDEKMVEMAFNLIKNGVVDNPLTKPQ